jgi:FxLD family lantipeptide
MSGKAIMLATDTETEDVFALDLLVVTDVRTDGGVAAPCGTDDGCDPTCASSCISNA